MSKEEARAILEFTLGSLLGFDDGASDVLDHLLTIESRQVSAAIWDHLFIVFYHRMNLMCSMLCSFVGSLGISIATLGGCNS
jgi:hypothetical protein